MFAKDIDLTCFKTFPIKAATCLQVGPMSLDWPRDLFAKFVHYRSSLSPEVPSDEQQRGALPASTREQNTLTRHIFSHLHALISRSHVT